MLRSEYVVSSIVCRMNGGSKMCAHMRLSIRRFLILNAVCAYNHLPVCASLRYVIII
jgi:hypothetical protein